MADNKTISLPENFQTHEVASVFAALDHNARFVGGCVRDALVKRPIRDIDITTPLTPDEVTKRLESQQIKAIPTGIAHGTITAVIGEVTLEITTLREDTACFGRHAEVAFSTDYKLDASRRDFTINAMSCDMEGNLYDYFGGAEDLEKGIIRFVGESEARVQEDYLRILRYFRFLGRYGKNGIAPSSLHACATHAEGIEQLSGERIQTEMMQILALESVSKIVEIMLHTNVLPFAIPKMIMPINPRDPLEVEGELLVTLNELIKIEQKEVLNSDPMVRLALLLRHHTYTNEALPLLLERWKLSNRNKKLLRTLIPLKTIPYVLPKADIKQEIRQLGIDVFKQLVLISWAESLATIEREEKRSEIDGVYHNILSFAKEWKAPTFPVSGKDLIEKGIEPGAAMGELLSVGEQWWESEEYAPSKKEILNYLANYKKA